MVNGIYVLLVALALVGLFQFAIILDNYERRLRREGLRRETWEKVKSLEML